ncbi:hypothetical protein GCM10027570_22010 [Streptomonospora sediminis]
MPSPLGHEAPPAPATPLPRRRGGRPFMLPLAVAWAVPGLVPVPVPGPVVLPAQCGRSAAYSVVQESGAAK